MPNPSLEIRNPSTGELVRTEIADTLESAHQKLDRAFDRYNDKDARLPLHERVALLEKLVEYLTIREDEFVTVMVQEGGKPWKDSVVEFKRALAGIKLAIHEISGHVGTSIPMGYQPSSAGRVATTQLFPVGVVLAYSAFNHPLNLIVHQIIPAFATGCPCVVKPAADTPLSCIALVKAMHEVGIPEDDIQVVVTSDLEIAGSLIESEKIAFFTFIGSARVGWMLRSKLQPGVRCALEHGGVAPCIVTKTADIDQAVASITKGAFYHAGQVCVSIQRLYVDASIYDSLIEKLIATVSQLKVADAQEADTDIGPLIRTNEITRIHSWVTEAIDEGAKCLTGGKQLGDYFYEPTVLSNANPNSKVMTQEIFGPVLCVTAYDDFNEVVELANHKDFAFQAAIFSHDTREINKAFSQIDASAIMVNDHTAFRDDVMPFAGLKASGLGTGGIPYTIEDMQYEKMLVLNTNT